MSCIEERVTMGFCPNCYHQDELFKGHGSVIFCNRCTLSWSPNEQLSLVKKVELPPHLIPHLPADMLQRLAVYKATLRESFQFEAKAENLLTMSDTMPEIKARDWPAAMSDFTDVMRLVHLAMRMTSDDEAEIGREILKSRTAEFEATVSDYIAAIGCSGKSYLQAGPHQSELSKQSRADAASIVNTYNFDLTQAIKKIKEETPTASRGVYASRLRNWEEERSLWKLQQISLYSMMTTRQEATTAFIKNNGLIARMMLEPRVAREPICSGWINRGAVSFEVAEDNPSPYHIGCLHFWNPIFEEVEDCEDLWRG